MKTEAGVDEFDWPEHIPDLTLTPLNSFRIIGMQAAPQASSADISA